MCGITGVISMQRDMRIASSTVDSMTDSMTHRGPDGRGVWVSDDGFAALGHRRLAIIDLSADGRQPMSNSAGTVYVTFNGEIYNFRELRRDLERRGHRFRSQCDTEVLVYLYEAFGDEMVHRLDGDFAFALWDERRKRLLAVRDRVGVKPFYYAQFGSLFLFASEIKSLLRHPAVTADVDEEALYHYLSYLVTPCPRTLFRNICKLPAGSFLTIETGKPKPTIEIQKYWRPLPGQFQVDQTDPDGQLEHLFQQSVDKRMMSDVPVGLLFSGGVDSTLNAGFFQRAIAPERVRTYNVSVAGDPASRQESEFARQMSGVLGTEHHEIQITEQDMLQSASRILEFQDEPISDPVSIPLYFITRYAKETGTTVLHAGEGADEIFCGYDNYRRFLRHFDGYWSSLGRLPNWTQSLAAKLAEFAPSPRAGKIADVLKRKVAGRGLFMSSAVAYYETEKTSILSKDFRRRSAGWDSYDVVAPFYEGIETEHPQATFLQKLTYLELQLRLPELLLMRVDKMSMAHGVEVRVPFLDSALIDFALSAPENFKLRDGVSKEPIKRLASQFVPKSLVYRKKTGFSAPIARWFQSELGEQMQDSLRTRQCDWERYFNVPALKTRLTRGPRTTNEAFQLWVVFNFMMWRDSCLSTPAMRAA